MTKIGSFWPIFINIYMNDKLILESIYENIHTSENHISLYEHLMNTLPDLMEKWMNEIDNDPRPPEIKYFEFIEEKSNFIEDLQLL